MRDLQLLPSENKPMYVGAVFMTEKASKILVLPSWNGNSTTWLWVHNVGTKSHDMVLIQTRKHNKVFEYSKKLQILSAYTSVKMSTWKFYFSNLQLRVIVYHVKY